jgi:hypothetical protein
MSPANIWIVWGGRFIRERLQVGSRSGSTRALLVDVFVSIEDAASQVVGRPTRHDDNHLPVVALGTLHHCVQAFIEQNEKRFLVINMPPRHYKSFTGTNLVEWYFGREPHRKVMTGSYNETLSTTFARKVRDTIEERRTAGGRLVYNDIFPETRIKYGQASASLWALQGNS